MLLALTLVSPDPQALAPAQARAAQAVAGVSGAVKRTRALGPAAMDLEVEADAPDVLRRSVDVRLAGLPVDFCLQPLEGRRKRLLVADMDSTIIGCECIDELADFAGVKPQVAEITERAMRGELDFEAALRERVAMLKGLPVEVLERCYAERVRLNPGAEILVKTMAANGARCVLVSGGFEFFTTRVAEAAGFHAQQANRLVEADGKLTGKVAEPILGREAKLAALKTEAATLGLDAAQTLGIGDGANDLAMIGWAGLGVAYRAKPVVAAQADARVGHADLTALLYFHGYEATAFVES